MRTERFCDPQMSECPLGPPCRDAGKVGAECISRTFRQAKRLDVRTGRASGPPSRLTVTPSIGATGALEIVLPPRGAVSEEFLNFVSESRRSRPASLPEPAADK